MSLLCWGLHIWLKYSRWGLSAEHRDRIIPHPAGHSALEAAQDMVDLLGCEGPLLVHGQLPIHPQVPCGSAPSLHSPVCTDSRSYHNPGARPCIWVNWTSWGSPGPTAQASLGLSQWHPVPQMYQLHHAAWRHLQTCWGCTWSYCWLMKMLKSTSPSTDPWGTPLLTDLHPDTEALVTILWVQSQFLIHWTAPPIQSIPFHFGEKNAMGDSVSFQFGEKAVMRDCGLLLKSR